MAQYKGNFKCIILSPRKIVYENEIQSIFLKGDQGEFEVLAYHYPLLGVLSKSNVIINGSEEISIKGGVVRFFANECIILVEESFEKVEKKKAG